MNKKIISEDFQKEDSNKKSNVNQNQQTKNKSNAQKAMPWLIVVIVSLIVILTCTLIAYYQVYKSGKQNANVLEGVYASSYFSMVDNVNNLSVDISKYENLSSNQAKLKTMQDIQTDCTYVLAGLNTLPINQENVTSATKFFNQINGLCEAYSKVLTDGENLTQEQELVFSEIGLVLDEIKTNLNTQNLGMYDSNFNFIDAGVFDDTGMNELSASMGDMTAGAIDYPAMIFDGPFSTALETKEVKGLGGKFYNKEDAENYLKNRVFQGQKVVVKYIGETAGDISTFDYEIETKTNKFSAQVSKEGCLLITLSGYANSADPIMTVGQAVEMAKTFANNIGFESMDSVWQEKNENVVYINLVYMKDDVIYYPDMVKVKVDLTSQEIIGFEAVNYAFNHTQREFEFNAELNDLDSLLGFDYEVIKETKAVIRLDSGKEIATYELITERIDGTYFYYIDANNLEIVKTLKLVDVKNVEKLI